jgi:hypothetical protein
MGEPMEGSYVALAFYTGTFPVVVVVPGAMLYLQSPTQLPIWLGYPLISLAVLWSTVVVVDKDLLEMGTITGYGLFTTLTTIGCLVTLFILALTKALSEHMQYQRHLRAVRRQQQFPM